MVAGTQGHHPEPREIDVPVAITDVQVPTVMGGTTVGLNHETLLDQKVHSPDTVEPNLRSHPQALSDEGTPKHGLLPRLGPAVDQAPEPIESGRQRREDPSDVAGGDESQMQSAVERRHGMPRMLAAHGLGECIQDPHHALGGLIGSEERGPVQPELASFDQAPCAMRRSESGRRVLQMHMSFGVEAEHAQLTQGRYAGEPPSDPHGSKDRRTRIGMRVPAASHTHELTRLHCRGELSISPPGSDELLSASDESFDHFDRVTAGWPGPFRPREIGG